MVASNQQIELMSKARGRASFKSRLLTCIIYGGEKTVHDREAVFNRVETTLQGGSYDQTKLPTIYGNAGRDEAYLEGLKWGKVLMEEELRHGHGIFNMETHQYALTNASPFGLHPMMFMPTLKMQASAEQKAKWLPDAESGRIIGAYVQTELGHGTFVRGVETTATFDEAKDIFVIHSPTLSSTKYWPGSLGFSASHAVVMARLIIKAKDYGVHPFMVQLRSLEDWRPVPGIEMGDIGLKIGLNTTDNGYCVFHHVCIPRTNMLMGISQVDRDGTYKKKGPEKISYGTMLFVRNRIIHTVTFQLAQAATIATRYSTVRTQGHGHYSESAEEVPIMAFKSQHYRLLGLIAQSYALLFAGNACNTVYQHVLKQLTTNNATSLPYCHSLVAGLKAYAAQITSDGAEDARKCCGGHGYSLLSGLPDIVAMTIPHSTWEGENHVMYQQTARYLVKCVIAIKAAKPVDPPMQYLAAAYAETKAISPSPAKGTDFLEPKVQLAIFRHRAVRLVFEAEDLVRNAERNDNLKRGRREAWNECMMELIAAARAHIEFYVLEQFIAAVATIEDIPLRKVMKNVCDLFALNAIESHLSHGAVGFVEDGYLCLGKLRTIRHLVKVLHKQLVPESIALTDAWNFSDACLQSALGMKDGNVYETMMEWTRQLPINVQAKKDGDVHKEGWERYIKPMLKGNGAIKSKL